LRCVLRKINEESNIYKLYDLIPQMIIVSINVVFEENKEWKWDNQHESTAKCELEWEDGENVVSEEFPVEEDVVDEQLEESFATNQENSNRPVEWGSIKQSIWLRDYAW